MRSASSQWQHGKSHHVPLAVAALIGFNTVTGQVLLFRELLVLSGGSEIWLGLMFAAWLLWTALGSGLLGRVGSADPRRTAARLMFFIAAALPLTIFFARTLKPALPRMPGELAPPLSVLVSTLLILAPFCVACGWLFAAAGGLYKFRTGQGIGHATSSIYLFEALSAAAAGIVTTFLLLPFLEPFTIALLVSCLNLALGAWLRHGSRPAAFAASAGVLIMWLCSGPLEQRSLVHLWRPFDLVQVKNTIYGNLALTRHEDSYTLWENAVPLFTIPDPESAERTVHYALLQHPAPRSLLLIGGGAGGALEEALRHPTLNEIAYVELDPAVIHLARAHLGFNAPAQATLYHMDGRRFLKTASRAFDVIILSLPEPYTAQLNRYYTLEFFAEVRARLNVGGVFSFALPLPESYVSPVRARLLSSLRGSLQVVFSDVMLLPSAGTVRFLASPTPGTLTRSVEVMLKRLRERGINTRFVSPAYLPFESSSERQLLLEAALDSLPGERLNRDFSPVSYYFAGTLWSSRFSPASARSLQRLSSVQFGPLLLFSCLLSWGSALLLLRRRSRQATCALAVFLVGALLMAVQILLLLGFQAVCGYVYSQLALITAMFMGGMALGSWAALRGCIGWTHLALIQASCAVAPLMISLLMEGVASRYPLPWLFSVLAGACGFLGGFQFPTASRLFFDALPPARHPSAGFLYALDLVGACLGSLLASLLLLPLYGFRATALFMTVACLAPALPAWVLSRSAPAR